MCLVAFASARDPRFPWVFVSNRDEFFDRAAAPLGWWRPEGMDCEVLGGRDLAAGGTWLALTRDGTLALLTNVREPGRHDPHAASRGALVLQALQPKAASDGQLLLDQARQPRNGYNLLRADLLGDRAIWASNRPQPQQHLLRPGLYGLSNAALDTPWPKVTALKRRLDAALVNGRDARALAESAFTALRDESPAADSALPATGVSLQRERLLSPAFIRIPPDADPEGPASYGTRCSTVVVVEQVGATRRVLVIERRHDATGHADGDSEEYFVCNAGR